MRQATPSDMIAIAFHKQQTHAGKALKRTPSKIVIGCCKSGEGDTRTLVTNGLLADVMGLCGRGCDF